MTGSFLRSVRNVFFMVAFILAAQVSLAQETSAPKAEASAESVDIPTATTTPSPDLSRRITRLESISVRIETLVRNRAEYLAARGGVVRDLSDDEKIGLQEFDVEIAELTSAFELLALGDVDTSSVRAPEKSPFDWRQEVNEIAAPIVDSLKKVTEKPRQIAALRDALELNNQQLKTANKAIAAINQQLELPITDGSRSQLVNIRSEWTDTRQDIEDNLVANETRLTLLVKNDVPIGSRLRNSMQSFLVGRGLTLLMAVGAAIVAILIMRAIWWWSTHRLITKNTRRKAIWFRILSYSYALLTGLVMFFAVIAVLQVRQDTLLLAVALVLVVLAALGLRNYLPNYISETRLLLNIGPVREDERIMRNGIPWNVETINLQSVLRNPALNGVVRLPIAEIKNYTSRPYKDELWFPAERDDYILLPDETFGRVLELTPELVQIEVRGGMVKSITASEFYAMPIMNLSRGDTYGIATTFGLDYGLQNDALDGVPSKLKATIQAALIDNGFEDTAESLLVELNGAGDSSLDFLIYSTVSSAQASSYFKVKRVVLQACVAASNKYGWSIPYPQMVMHQV